MMLYLTRQGEVHNKWCCWGFLEGAQAMAVFLLPLLQPLPLILKAEKIKIKQKMPVLAN